MTVELWRIAANTAKYVANDMSGTGAKNTGGRWNPVGMAVTYGSENIALAVHETVVHLRSGGLPLNRYLVRIDVPDDVWAARQVLTLPVGWDARPHIAASQLIGDEFLRSAKFLALRVPSVIIREEDNILINPYHLQARNIEIVSVEDLAVDPRLK